jgi:hypothetical protein
VRLQVDEIIAKHRDAMLSQRYLFQVAPLMGLLRDGDWKWADLVRGVPSRSGGVLVGGGRG